MDKILTKKEEYQLVLKDPRWQRKRLEILNRDNFTCQKCKSATDTLHVHHRHYIAGRFPWDYSDNLLVTLCQKCHEKEEADKFDASDLLHSFHYFGMFNSEIRSVLNKILEDRIEKISQSNAKQSS